MTTPVDPSITALGNASTLTPRAQHGSWNGRGLLWLFASAGLFSLWFSLMIYGQPLGAATHLLLLAAGVVFGLTRPRP